MKKIYIFSLILYCLLSSRVGYSQNCAVNADVDQVICANQVMTLNGQITGSLPSETVTTWSQIGGPSVVITNPALLVTTVTGFTGGTTYVFRLTTTCLDGALTYDDVTFTVTPITIANAGPDAAYCPGTGAGNLSANAVSSGETGTWTIIGTNNAGVSVVTASSPTSSINLATTSAGLTTLRWTITRGVCTSYDDVVITNYGGVSPVTAGPDQNLSACYSTTTSTTLAGSFDGNGFGGQTGQWVLVSGPNNPTFGNINAHNSSLSNLIPGTYTLRWLVSGPCANGFDEVVINVPTPVGSVTSVGNLTNQTFCDLRTTATLTGPTPLYINESAKWTIVSKPAGATDPVFSDDTNPITQVTFSGAGQPKVGTYRFRYRITNSLTGCLSQDESVDIVFNQNPALNAGPDQVLTCNANTTTISGTQSGSGTPEYKYISWPTGFTPPNTNWNAVTTSNIGAGTWSQTYTNLNSEGTYVLQFRKSSGTNNSCGTVFDDLSIIVSKTPTSSNSGSSQLLACNIDSTDLVGNIPTVGYGTWYQVSGPNIADLLFPANNRTPITDMVPGLYQFRWLITGGPACPTKQRDTRVVVANATPTQANAGPDVGLCYGTPFQLQGNNPVLNETGTWAVNPTSGVTFSPDVNNPQAIINGLSANTVYRLIWTINNSCGITRDTMFVTTTNVQGAPLSNAGADICRPSGTTSVQLDGSSPAPGTGTWTAIPSTGITFTPNANTRNATVNGLSDGTYLFEWSIAVVGCDPTRDTVMVTISAPVTPANAGPDQIICGNSAILAANNPTVGTGLWELMAGPPGILFADSTLFNTEVSFLTEGSYTLYWTISIGACASSVDSVVIRIEFPPEAAQAGKDTVYCNVTTLPVTMNFYATPVTNGTGLWTFVSGPGTPTIANPLSPTSQVSNLNAGTYTFRWTVTSGPYCPPSTDDMKISILPKAYAGADAGYCDITEILLTGNAGTTGTWQQVAGPSATLTVNGPNTAIASGLMNNNVYRFRYLLVASTLDIGGCSSVDTVQYTIYAPATPSSAGTDLEYCQPALPVRDTFYLSGNAPAGGETGTWTRLSGPVTGTFLPNANVQNAKFVPGGTTQSGRLGTYYFVWTIANGSCTSADQVRVVNYAQPSLANAGSDIVIVCDTFAIMAATPVTSGIGIWSQVDGPSGPVIAAPYQPNTIISNLKPITYPATYKFMWAVSNGPCAVNRDTVSITVYEKPTEPDAGPDQALCEIFTFTMQGNLITVGTGLWSQYEGPAAIINNPSFPDAYIEFPGTGVYKFIWTSSAAPCSLADSVKITIYDSPSVADAGIDRELCQFEMLFLAATAPDVGTGLWTQHSGPNAANILNPSSPNTQVIGIILGTYRFVWTVSNGTCPPSTDTVTIAIADSQPPMLNCPLDIAAQCSAPAPYASYALFTSAGGSASDNCGINPASFGLLTSVSDGFTCPETITRTYKISDLSGNQATCTQIVTIDDTQPPAITCPSALTAQCTAPEAYNNYVAFVTAGGSASDNCGIDETSFTHVGDVSDGESCPEVITRTYSIEDLCGNESTCTQTITIDDTQLPSLTCPSALTAQCTAPAAYADYAAFVTAGGSATDNCGIDETSLIHAGDVSDGESCPEVITRTYRIADECGNETTCTQAITIDDTEVPSLSCPGALTAQCTAPTAYADYGAFVIAGGSATDNCGIDETSFTHVGDVSDGESCPEVITRTYRIADECGNETTCTQAITIDDTEVPSLSCPGALTAQCTAPAAYTDYAAFVTAGGSATDNCGIDETSFIHAGDVSDGETCPEVITRTYRIADDCGNETTCTQTITINDTQAPSLTCPGALTAQCTAPAVYADYAAFVTAGGSATDNCGIDETSFIHAGDVSDGETCPEVITRTYRIADECGNETTCTQTITINDTEAPSLTCPGALTAQCTAQAAYTDYAAFVTAGGSATDNCGIDETSFIHAGDVSDGETCPEVITRTYRIADECGNETTCTQTITIDDTEAPSLSCPGALTAQCTAQAAYTDYAAFVTAGGSATDNCGIDETSFTHVGDVSDGESCPEVITRTYRVADECGNETTCTQTITIDDTQAPSLNCPGSLTAQCTAPAAYTDYAAFVTAGGSATDNCGIDETSFIHAGDVSDVETCPEVITRTYRIADDCGNETTCTQTITINDTQAPSLNCPGALTAQCTAPAAYADYAAFVTAGGSATDNCGIDEASFTHVGDVSDGESCPEVITRTYRIADDCGNETTCAQTITLDDTQAPSLTCPGSLTAQCTAPAAYADYAAFVTAGGSATDNCSIDEASFTHVGDVSDGESCPEVITRTYRIADECGNEATCTQTITINDTQAPSLNCPGALTAQCTAPAAYTDYAAFVTAGGSATDNCGIDEASFTHVGDLSDGESCPEVITRTYRIADDCGNETTCTRSITIDDTQAPSLNCPGALTAQCTAPTAYADYGTFITAGGSATDNCGIDETSFIHVGDVSDGESCPEVITRTYRIADDCGNETTCTQSITIDDTEAPSLSCPGAQTAQCTAPAAYADYSAFVTAGGSATDNCGIDEASFTHVGDVSDGESCPEVITRTYRIADDCGNETTCTQSITIDDTQAPSLNCPGALTAQCTAPTAYADYGTFITAGGSATDNCGIDETSFIHVGDVSDGETCPEVITRTYRIADECGNETTCTQTITINDTQAPSLNCPGALTAQCTAPAAYTDYAAFVTAGGSATDNCSIDEASFTHVGDVSDGESCPEVITRTYRIADDCGNETTCAQTITIDDTQVPSLTCPGSLTAQCTAPAAYTDYAAFVTAGGSATDNCGIDETSFIHAGDVSDGETCPEVITRTYRIADDCGNETTCAQTITINDTELPSLTCPDGLIAVCEAPVVYADYTAFVTAGGSASDNCGIDVYSFVWVEDISDGNTNPETITRIYKIEDLCGNEATCEQIIIIDDINVETWVYLEGSAIDPGGIEDYTPLMRTDLNDLHILPGQTYLHLCGDTVYTAAGQPYNVAPWNYGGNEGDDFDSNRDPLIGEADYPLTVVDWVLISLRETPDGGPLCQKAALLHNNGSIQFIDGGFTCCTLDYSTPYYIVIEHRNHLMVMSDTAISASEGIISYDFRHRQSYINNLVTGGSGQKEILPGLYAMFAGNGDQVLTVSSDTRINLDDETYWQSQNGKIGSYLNGDYNMNGDCNFNDRVTWEFNNTVFTTVPRD